jgi:hypothetical protein
MTTQLDELLRDPLFQINTMLWLAQPLADDGNVDPLLHKAGFVVYAIAPLLPLPPDIRLVLQERGISAQDMARPDAVLAQQAMRRFALTECKARSFGPASSTAEQARTFLLFAGGRAAEVLGLGLEEVREVLLVVIIPDEDRGAVASTLGLLQRELTTLGLPAGEFAVLGLMSLETHLALNVDEKGGAFLGLPLGVNEFMKCEPDTDPRPLYFIPYDPDLTQSPSEARYCKRVLFERIHSTVVAAVGRANPPVVLLLQSDQILNDAMFGMFEHWENKDSGRHMRGLCRELMGALTTCVNSVALGTMSQEPGSQWKLTIEDRDHQALVFDVLCRFSSETMDLRPGPQLSFLDDD